MARLWSVMLLGFVALIVGCFGVRQIRDRDFSLEPVDPPAIPDTIPPHVFSADRHVTNPGTIRLDRHVEMVDWIGRNALQCRGPELMDTSKWVRHTQRGYGSIKIPKNFKQDPALWSYHGGFGWSDGDRSIAIQYGWWQVDTTGKRIRACAATVRAGRFLVHQRKQNGKFVFTAQAPPYWAEHKQIIAAGPSLDDVRMAWTALHTYSSTWE
jgi:hypothetical protein